MKAKFVAAMQATIIPSNVHPVQTQKVLIVSNIMMVVGCGSLYRNQEHENANIIVGIALNTQASSRNKARIRLCMANPCRPQPELSVLALGHLHASVTAEDQ